MSVSHLDKCGLTVHFAMQTIWKYDYGGIVALIVASFIPPIWFGFLCEPALRNFYLISTCIMGKPWACVFVFVYICSDLSGWQRVDVHCKI